MKQISNYESRKIVNDQNVEKSETERETFEPIEKLKYPQDHISVNPILIVLNGLNQKGNQWSQSSGDV